MFRLFGTLVLLFYLSQLLAGPRDPMQPFGYRVGEDLATQGVEHRLLQPGMFRLSAIFCGPRGKRAVINERHLEEGDKIEGARLVSIASHAVELELQGKKITVKLLPITVKTPSKGVSGEGK